MSKILVTMLNLTPKILVDQMENHDPYEWAVVMCNHRMSAQDEEDFNSRLEGEYNKGWTLDKMAEHNKYGSPAALLKRLRLIH